MSTTVTMNSTTWRQVAIAVAALLLVGGSGAWLSLSYLGYISNDVRIEAHVPDLGESLGPGAKVRYDGIIVGRVVTVSRTDDGYIAEILVKPHHAEQIPANATARILPSTLFGSEYVEIVGNSADLAAHGNLRSVSAIHADESDETVRLMESYVTAEKLIAAIDVREIEHAMSQLATALDGNGENISDFLRRNHALARELNEHSALYFGQLRQAANVSHSLTDMLADLTEAAEHGRTPATTIIEVDPAVGQLLRQLHLLSDRGHALIVEHGDQSLRALGALNIPLGTAAEHDAAMRLVLSRVPNVLHNGASSIKNGSIQMEGMFGFDPYDPYTAADCARYGGFPASNCGNPVPEMASSPAPTSADDALTLESITLLLTELRGGGS